MAINVSPKTAHPALTALRIVVFCAALLPLARLFWLGTNDGLSANPVEFVTRSTGTWALVFLCLSLSMTPLRRLTKQTRWMSFRRMLGLYCFFYATLHFILWLWIEHALDFAAMWQDIIRRPFIAAGFSAFVLLIPLAVTSTRGMMRRLGHHWVQLHRMVYLIAIAAILHYWWHKAGKNDFGTVSIYTGIVASLLGIRLWWLWQDSRRRNATKAPDKSTVT